MSKRWLPLLALIIGLSGCGGEQDSQLPPAPVSPGQEFFLSNCASCHQGPGNPPGPNAIVTQSAVLASEEAFLLFLRKPTSPMMPAFSVEQMPDSQARELYAYLKTQVSAKPQ
ncbi:MAG TPA: cytochrome c [Coleofasciculaceae cyanobacterium]